jgi:GTP cyclohydrolase II/3,4-dihydroxy 2-butanone 4-phosphate synthase/GTP cyclohydrolase II
MTEMSSVLNVAEAIKARADSDRGRAGAIFTLPRFSTGGAAIAKDTKTDMFVDVARTTLPIEFQGREVKLEAHAYEDDTSSYQAMAVLHRRGGEGTPLEPGIKRDEIPLVRVHSGCVTGDIFHSLRCDCYAQLQLSLERIIESDLGMIIYLPHHEGRGIGLVNKIKAYKAQDEGLDTVDANLSIGAPVDARDYELPAKILKDLGYETIRLMSNNPLKHEALERHGIKVVEQVRTVTPPSEHNERYLATKRERMSHKL